MGPLAPSHQYACHESEYEVIYCTVLQFVVSSVQGLARSFPCVERSYCLSKLQWARLPNSITFLFPRTRTRPDHNQKAHCPINLELELSRVPTFRNSKCGGLELGDSSFPLPFFTLLSAFHHGSSTTVLVSRLPSLLA